MRESNEVLRLLDEWRQGDQGAYDQLIPLVYTELRQLAQRQLRNEATGHSLQPTLLVHEAYLRLADADIDWQNRTHFLSVAARVMRRILVERARARQARKRGGDEVRVTLTGSEPAPITDPVGVLSLNAAMERLRGLRPPTGAGGGAVLLRRAHLSRDRGDAEGLGSHRGPRSPARPRLAEAGTRLRREGTSPAISHTLSCGLPGRLVRPI